MAAKARELMAPHPHRVLTGPTPVVRWGDAHRFAVQGLISFMNSVN